jgi:hypothetical protein
MQLFEQTHKDNELVPTFVMTTFRRVQASDDLCLKRGLWLMLLVCCEPINEYALGHSGEPARARAFMEWLKPEFDKLFSGGYHAFDREIPEFVALAQMTYNA